MKQIDPNFGETSGILYNKNCYARVNGISELQIKEEQKKILKKFTSRPPNQKIKNLRKVCCRKKKGDKTAEILEKE